MWKTIWNRSINLFKSKSLPLVDAIEHPAEMYDMSIQESELIIENLKEAIVSNQADQENIESQMKQAKIEAESWKVKAKAALDQAEADWARIALERKVIAEKKVEDFSCFHETLKKKIEELNKEFGHSQLRHEALKAQKAVCSGEHQMEKVKT